MIRLIVSKSGVLIGSALAGTIVVFLLLRLLGGDAAAIILGQGATPESLAALRKELGLDKSWPEQYIDWISGLLRGDLGNSYAAGYDIFAEIVARVGLTLSLAIATLIVSWLLGLAAGTYSALHARKIRGDMVDIVAQLGIAVPSFWTGLLLIGFVSIEMGWLPAGGYVPWTEDPAGTIRSLVLPVIALATTIVGVNTRFVRSSMLDVLSQDYIRTAMAKGRTWRSAALTHGLRNAAIPLVTVGVLQLGSLLSGVVVIENVFALPGLGQMLTSAVATREAVVVQSLALVIILLVLVLNFVMDITYGLLDPRIRQSKGAPRHG